MVRPLLVRRLAEADIESAAQWYEGERAELGARFLADLDRTFTRIREQPLQFPSIGDDIRRALPPPSRTPSTSVHPPTFSSSLPYFT